MTEFCAVDDQVSQGAFPNLPMLYFDKQDWICSECSVLVPIVLAYGGRVEPVELDVRHIEDNSLWMAASNADWSKRAQPARYGIGRALPDWC